MPDRRRRRLNERWDEEHTGADLGSRILETGRSKLSAHPHTDDESDLATISREMVNLFKEQFGRGPSRARTHWAGPDMIVCLLEETLTPAERNLAFSSTDTVVDGASVEVFLLHPPARTSRRAPSSPSRPR